ncbi:hypothetical protein D917_06471 [Trichinella nativa]|uniref:RRM domain-containing protein n=1 Tax=Trichinella nativa TaxID=6335 RepID=A0A1Y3ESA6_9BILA|nr:hypothetical protein D917_06471 [Trichinella nativa]
MTGFCLRSLRFNWDPDSSLLSSLVEFTVLSYISMACIKAAVQSRGKAFHCLVLMCIQHVMRFCIYYCYFRVLQSFILRKMRVPVIVTNLPNHSSDFNIKSGLYHKFKRLGKVTDVKVIGFRSDRYAILHFENKETAQAVVRNARNDLFFGKPIMIALAKQSMDIKDNDNCPYVGDGDHHHKTACRTLYIGKLSKHLTVRHLLKYFRQFGDDIQIKHSHFKSLDRPFCFIQFADITSAEKAIAALKVNPTIGRNRVKNNLIWINELPADTSKESVLRKMSIYGQVTGLVVDTDMRQAVVVYKYVIDARNAFHRLKSGKTFNCHVQVDYCNFKLYWRLIDRMEERQSSGSSRLHSRSDSKSTQSKKVQSSITRSEKSFQTYRVIRTLITPR